ncbi:MAG: hypothetical protein Q7T59_06215 [Candidatus Woesebacteria bacterium]|nr:hypothetical protein [Candidatus Woesebacteria bacterium]
MTAIPPVAFDSTDELTALFDEDQDAEGAARGPAASAAPAGPMILDPSNRKLYTRQIRKLQKVPILGFVGLNGQGKSYNAVRSILPAIAEGAPVLSTVALLDPHTGNDHPQYTRLNSWQQLLDFKQGVCLLDEVTGIMDARDQGMPKPVRRHVHQARRAGVLFRWTGIDWDNTDKRMRQITSAVVRCRGYMPVPGQSKVSMWAPNRLFVFTTFDAQTLTASEDSRMFTESSQKRRKAKVLGREIVWGPGSPAFQCYNTLDSVAWVDNSCPECGGKPMEKTCRGH